MNKLEQGIPWIPGKDLWFASYERVESARPVFGKPLMFRGKRHGIVLRSHKAINLN